MSDLVMMYWSCPYCDGKNIPGKLRECPNCGKPRGEGTKFYFKDSSRERVSDEEASKVSKKADWYCAYCNSLNSANDETCVSCGSPRNESTDDYFSLLKKKEEKENNIDDSYDNDAKRYSNITSHYSEKTLYPNGRKKSFFENLKDKFRNNSFLKAGSFIFAFLLVVAFLFILLVPKTKDINVTGHEWSKQISIEHLNTYDESSFSPPAGARIYDEKTEIERYDEVVDHYETQTETYQEYVQTGTTTRTEYRDLGNGYAEAVTVSEPTYGYETRTRTVSVPVYRSVPVYGTKYYYEIDRWEHERYVTSSGNDMNDYWPDFNLFINERQGTKSESFTILAVTDDEEVSYSCNKDIWLSLSDGNTFKVKVSLGAITEIVE